MPIFLNKTIISIVIINISFQFLCAVHCTEGFSYIILLNHHEDLSNTTTLERRMIMIITVL